MGEEQLASWEKHTKGIGSKLLQKFGFTGKLGANESGITKPIEVTVRATNAGLGFGNSASSGRQDKKSFKSQEDQFKIESGKRKRSGNLQNSRKHQKPTSKRDSIEDLLISSQQASAFVDDETSESEDEDRVIEIQQFRVGLPLKPQSNPIIEKLENLQYHKNRLETKLSVLKGDMNETKNRKKDLTGIITALKQVDHFIDDIRTINVNDEDKAEEGFLEITNKLRATLKSFSLIFSQHQRECSLFGVSRCFSPLFNQLFRMLFIARDNKHRFSRLTTAYDWFESFIAVIQSFMITLPQYVRSYLELSVLPQVLQQTVLQELHLFTSHEYNPVFHSHLLVDYLLTLSSYLSSTEIESFLKFAVVPQIMKFVQYWQYNFESGQYSIAIPQPSTALTGDTMKSALRGSDDYFLFHHWILPFFRLSDHIRQFSPLYPEIRKKMVQLIRNWPSNTLSELRFTDDCELFVKLLSPWKDIFDQNSFDNLIIKMLIPKLHSQFRKMIEVESAEQSYCLEVLLRFQSIFSAEVLEILTISEFSGPKLVSILRDLLEKLEGNGLSVLSLMMYLRQVMDLLVHWQESLPDASLLVQSSQLLPLRATSLFEKAIDFIDSMTNAIISYFDKTEPAQIAKERLVHLRNDLQTFVGMMEQLHYESLLKFMKYSSETTTGIDSSKPNLFIPDSATSSLTVLKDAIERIALQMNVEFMPVKSVKSSGPAYRIGNCLICILQETLCLHNKSSNSWLPITPIELQEAVRSSL